MVDLRTALEEVAGLGLAVEQRDAPAASWLAAPDLVGGRLDALVAEVTRGAGTDREALGAEWLFEHHAWQGAALTAAAALTGGWVPDLSPSNVLVDFRDGAIWGVALRGGAVRRPAGDEALAAAGRAALVEHLTPLAEALAGRGLRAPSALWRAAGDRVAQAYLWCATVFADPDRATALAERTLTPPSPMHVPLQVAHEPDGTPFHVRSSCCLYHRVPGALICSGCPLHRSRRERARAAAQ